MLPDNRTRSICCCILVASTRPAPTEASGEVKAVGVVRDNEVLVPPNYSSLVLWLIIV